MAKAQATESAEMFAGVDTDKFDAVSIASALEKLGIAPSSKASLLTRAGLLKKHFDAAHAGGAKLLDCENCEASSTADFDACPFCGVGEDAPEAGEVEPEGPQGANPGEDFDDEEDDAGDVPPPDDAKEEVAVVEAPQADVVEMPAQDPDAKPVVPPSPVAGQKLEPLKKPRKGSKGASALAVVPAVAQVVDGMIDPSLSPIDKFVAEIKYLRRATEVGGYMLAKRLAEGEISGVWKTRLDEKQKSTYRNFETFAQIELEMTARYVREQLQLYNRFTEEQFKALKPSKLRLILQVAPDAQPKVLDAIKGGASRRQIEREYLGRKNADTQGAKGKAKPELSKSGKVTLALVEQKQKFAFVRKDDHEKPAKRIGETPWAKLPISTNDVEVLVTVTTNARGEFVGTVEVRRVDPTK